MADKEAVARFGAFSLANLITDLRILEPTRKIHLVAHSMGCFLTLKALNMLAILHHVPLGKVQPQVDTVIWLAPDINADALERSTPATLRAKHWHALGVVPKAHHLLDQLQTLTAEVPHAGQTAPTLNPHLTAVRDTRENYLDGYGYAALNVVRHAIIYCSLRDEAMWISPLANHLTEEGGSASGGVRLGWCGPLHPDLMLVHDPDAGEHPRRVTLVECTPVVSEHGDYFYLPVTQRDITTHLLQAQARDVASPEQAPNFPERALLPQWLAKTPLEYPNAEQTSAEGLVMYQLLPSTAEMPDATLPRAGAPCRASSPMSFVWDTPLHVVGDAIVAFKRFHRLVLGAQPEPQAPR